MLAVARCGGRAQIRMGSLGGGRIVVLRHRLRALQAAHAQSAVFHVPLRRWFRVQGAFQVMLSDARTKLTLPLHAPAVYGLVELMMSSSPVATQRFTPAQERPMPRLFLGESGGT